jgi:hypothetical protein
MRYVLSALAISFVLAVPPAQAQAVPGLAARMERAATFTRIATALWAWWLLPGITRSSFSSGYGYANLESKTPSH